MRRALFCISLAAAILAFTGRIATAHANYVQSNPTADARLTTPPAEIHVKFSETPALPGSDVAVFDVAGKRMDKGDVAVAGDEPDALRVSVDGLPEGGYLVSWTAVSAIDGHETKGTFAFVVGDAPLPKLPDIAPLAPPPAPFELIGRAFSFTGVAMTLGSVFFALFIYTPTDAIERLRERRLIFAGGVLLIAGSSALVASYRPAIPLRLLIFIGLRGLAGAVAIATFWMPERPVLTDLRRKIAAFTGLASGLSVTLVSHAAASRDPGDIALDFMHVMAISIWSGSVLSLLVLAKREPRALGATVWRLSVAALVAVAIVITTGVLQSLNRLVLVWDLVETPYGIALLMKIGLLVSLVALGALNLLVWGPRLRAGIPARTGLIRGVAAETILFGAAFGATAFLTAFAPPSQRGAAAFDETQRVDGIRIELLVPVETPGRNRYTVRVHQGLTPVTNAERVSLRFTMVEHDMGEQELIGTERAAGDYVSEGSPSSMYGTWKIQVIVRLSGRPDLKALFTVPIARTQELRQG